MNDNMHVLRTPKELSFHPYPDNVRLGCVYWTEAGELYDPDDEATNGPWSTDNGSDYTFERNIEAWHWPCEVLDRSHTDNTYTVQIFMSPASDSTQWHHAGEERVIHNYPRNSINFFPTKRSSDQHLLGGFRQPIGLPNSMVPSSWKFDRYLK
jgi:hypothetical protein